MKREHFGSCDVFHFDLWGGSYPTMEGAISALDPFQSRTVLSLADALVTVEIHNTIFGGR
jgi:hypothetical protein